MYVLRLYFFVFLLFALFQSIIASRLGTVENHAPAVPTTVTRYRLIGTYSPTSSEPSPRGFGHIAPTPAPTTLPVLMPTTSDSSMLASFWAMFMPYLEVTTPVSVEHIETAAPAPVEVTTPVSVEVTTPESVEVAAPVSVEVTTPVSVEVAAPAPAKVAEHAEQVVGANTAESATTTPFAIVSMAIYRTTARTPSGHTPSPYTAWTAGRNTQRKTSSDAPCVAPATARPATRTTSEKSTLLRDTKSTSNIIECTLRTPSGQMHSPHTVWTSWRNIPRKVSSVAPATAHPATRTTPEKLALLRDTKSPSEIIECTLRTPSGQVPPPHAVWTAWCNTQRKISSASPCVAPATHVTSDMAEKLALLALKFVESTPRTPSGRIPGRTVVTPGRTEAEKAATMQAEAARAVAVRVRARQAAANSQTRRTKAHHS
ncbi:hypothetical protein H4R27_005184 [Coemansia aciculifera]|nr:hypothetical protein H4R27_005184 [Coemansia aciculifera]